MPIFVYSCHYQVGQILSNVANNRMLWDQCCACDTHMRLVCTSCYRGLSASGARSADVAVSSCCQRDISAYRCQQSCHNWYGLWYHLFHFFGCALVVSDAVLSYIPKLLQALTAKNMCLRELVCRHSRWILAVSHSKTQQGNICCARERQLLSIHAQHTWQAAQASS